MSRNFNGNRRQISFKFSLYIPQNFSGADEGGGGVQGIRTPPPPFLTRPSFNIFKTVHFLSGFPSFYKILTLDPPSKFFSGSALQFEAKYLPQIAPEAVSEHQYVKYFLGGSCPQTPLEVFGFLYISGSAIVQPLQTKMSRSALVVPCKTCKFIGGGGWPEGGGAGRVRCSVY